MKAVWRMAKHLSYIRRNMVNKRKTLSRIYETCLVPYSQTNCIYSWNDVNKTKLVGQDPKQLVFIPSKKNRDRKKTEGPDGPEQTVAKKNVSRLLKPSFFKRIPTFTGGGCLSIGGCRCSDMYFCPFCNVSQLQVLLIAQKGVFSLSQYTFRCMNGHLLFFFFPSEWHIYICAFLQEPTSTKVQWTTRKFNQLQPQMAGGRAWHLHFPSR